MTITFKLLEPDSPRYIYVNPVTNQVHLLMPVVSGTEIGLDNTCQSVQALKTFFGANTQDALDDLNHYQEALEFDLAILPDAHPLRALKKDRLEQIKRYQIALEALHQDTALMRLQETLPEYPDALKKLMEERSNLYSMVLRPETTDHYLRTVNPVFSVQRDGCILHLMPLDEAKQARLTHCYTWDGSNLNYIQSNGDDEHVEFINQQEFINTLKELKEIKTGTTIQLSANDMEQLITSNTTHVPTDNDQILYQALHDAYQHITIQGPAARLEHVVLTSQQGKSSVDFPSIQQTLTDTFQSMFGVTVHLLIPKDPAQPDQDLVAATKNHLDTQLMFDQDTTAKEYIDALIHYFARNIWNEIPASESPFNKIVNNATAPAKLSILTQFFLAEVNIYCFSQGISQANFGNILDHSNALSDLAATTVIAALDSGVSVEHALCQFVNEHAQAFHLEPGKTLISEDIKAIETRFTTQYTTIADSAELDEFLVLDTSKQGQFVVHKGHICTDFSEFIKAGYPALDTPYFQEIRSEFEHINGVIPHKNNIPPASIDIDIDAIKALIENLNEEDNTGAMIAYIAARDGHVAVIQALHAAGFDLNKPDKNGYTLTHIAAENNQAAIIQALHVAGADLNKPDNYGYTPAHIAAENNHATVIQALHAAGADLNKPDNYGYTPAHLAAAKNHIAIIQALHDAGADLNKSNKEGFTPAYLAAHNGHATIIQALHDAGADLNKPNDMGCTPAYIAAYYGHVAVIQALHNARADLNKSNKEGFTPASIAAHNGHVAIIQALHDAGADLNKPNDMGCTPVYLAAYYGHVAIIQALHNAGANLNQSTKDGSTPACIAAYNGHVAAIQALHATGADLNKPNKKGFSPLILAIRFNHIDVIRYLVEQNQSNTTPVQSKASDWRKMMSSCEIDIKQEMDNLILSKKKTDNLNELITLLPIEVARIMGNQDVIQALTRTNHITQQYKSSLPKNDDGEDPINRPEP